jgi:hypothetical protein
MSIDNIIKQIEAVNLEMTSIPEDKDLKAKKYNKLFDKRQKILDEVNKNIDLAESVYCTLLSSDSDLTRITVAANCLKLNLFLEESITVLEAVANGPYGRNRFSAHMVLEVYNGKVPGAHL